MRWLNQQLFLTVLDSRESQIKVPEESVSGEGLLSSSQTAVFSLYPQVAEGAPLVPFYNPIHEGSGILMCQFGDYIPFSL